MAASWRSEANAPLTTLSAAAPFAVLFAFDLNIPQSEIVIGIPAYSLPEDNTVPNALLMPFRKQRDYWRTPNGTLVERENAVTESNPVRPAK